VTALVVADLAELQGPSGGTVELPLRLFWSAADRRFDLSDPDMLRSMYEKVLREAIRTEDLTRFLNGGTLRDVWRDLFLPRDVRRAWEDRHPVLRGLQLSRPERVPDKDEARGWGPRATPAAPEGARAPSARTRRRRRMIRV
jgi:hypothetical protein